jgi:hypothetical protein
MKQKTTFEQLKAKVLPYLEHYQNDLLVHDKKILDEYTGPFVYGYRKTGTDLLRLHKNYDQITWKNQYLELDKAEEILRAELIWLTYEYRNSKFLYFDGNKLHEKTKQEVEKIYLDNVTRIINAKKLSATAIF